MDAALGLATALFTGAPVSPAAVEALRRTLQGIGALRCNPCALQALAFSWAFTWPYLCWLQA